MEAQYRGLYTTSRGYLMYPRYVVESPINVACFTARARPMNVPQRLVGNMPFIVLHACPVIPCGT